MFDYKGYFDAFCNSRQLDLCLSFDMPSGYENAYGTFDVTTKTVFINAKNLAGAPDYEKMFFLCHELRHSEQYLLPGNFEEMIIRSLQYVIMYNGTCFKLINGEYLSCTLDGTEEYFTNLYLGQPHEVDANTFAYEQTRCIYGDSESLRKLYAFWLPQQPIASEIFKSVFSLIDEKTA